MIRITQQSVNGEIRTGSIFESPRAIAIAIDCCVLALQWRNMRLDDDYVNFIFEIVPESAITQLAEELKDAGFGKLFDPAEDHHQMGFRRTGFRKPPKSTKKPISPRDFADRLGRELKTRDGEITTIFITWLKRQKQELGQRKTGQRDELSRRISKIAKMFRLSPCATDLFLSLHLLSCQQSLQAAISFSINCPSPLAQINFLSALGRWSPAEVRSELMENSALRRFELVDDGFDLSFCTTSYLEGLSKQPLVSQFFNEVTGKPLPLEAHADFAADIAHLKKLLAGRRQDESLNILFYGTPGTGKTELARSLGFALGYKQYEIKNMDPATANKGGQFRLTAIHACLNSANLDKAMIIVDEADDVLNCNAGSNFLAALFGAGARRNSGDKGSLNHILDSSKAAIIWISNAHHGIEESTRRRFDYSVEFTRFSKGQRLRVWQTSLGKHRLGGLSEADVEQLSREHAINAGGIELAVKNAVRILRADGVCNMRLAKREKVLAALSPTIRSHIQITGVSVASEAARPANQCYSLEGLNILSDQPLGENIEILRGFSNYLTNSSEGIPIDGIANEVRNMNVLLHGPPGTGKTEFAKFLARELGRPLHVRLASDLLDKYVGQSEKQIRAAFMEAEREHAVLLLDEADSLLHARSKAQHSWEITQVNEVLSNMESFRGILVCTTNFKGNLDPASLRRFNLKIGFDYLTPEGRGLFYSRMLAPMVSVPLNVANNRQIADLGRLTPGDFKVVRQRYGFVPKENITHTRLLGALAAEVASRKTDIDRPRVGFLQGNSETG